MTYRLDEMTGIQALERVMPGLDLKPGRCVRVEFEYCRHGTQTLIAALNVATGRIDQASVGNTRTEQDFRGSPQSATRPSGGGPQNSSRHGLP